MKKMIFAVMLMILMLSFTTVFADQDGRNYWCNVDQYGCWITNEDGGRTYIMFWSESARQYFMGDRTAPYKDVVRRYDGARLSLISVAPVPTGGTGGSDSLESICKKLVVKVNDCFGEGYTVDKCVADFKENGGAEAAANELENFACEEKEENLD